MAPTPLCDDDADLPKTGRAAWGGIAKAIALLLTGACAIIYRPDLLTMSLVLLLVLESVRSTRLLQKLTRQTLRQSHVANENKLLIESINCAPLAFALYDQSDRLIAWNKSYEAYYPKSFAAFQERADSAKLRYADLLRESAPDGLSPDQVDSFIADRSLPHRCAEGIPVDRHYPEVGWRRVTKFATPSGAVAGFAVDISETKQYEAELHAEIARRREIERQLQTLARTDSLTAALNRRAFMEAVEGEIARYVRYAVPVSIILLDIDWFKSINDRFGHQIGDEALIHVVDVAVAQIRRGVDQFGRIGGEEFCALLPSSDGTQAVSLAERMRQAIETVRIQTADGTTLSLTASFGISSVNPGNARLTTLIGEADRAMYVSKMEGRNRVTLYSNGITPAVNRCDSASIDTRPQTA